LRCVRACLLVVSSTAVLGLPRPPLLPGDGRTPHDRRACRKIVAGRSARFLRTRKAARRSVTSARGRSERGAGRIQDAEHEQTFCGYSDDLTILAALRSRRSRNARTIERRCGSRFTQYKGRLSSLCDRGGFQLLAKDFAHWRVDIAGAKLAKTKVERNLVRARPGRAREDRPSRSGNLGAFVGDGSMPMHAACITRLGQFPQSGRVPPMRRSTCVGERLCTRHHYKRDCGRHVAYADCSCAIEAPARRPI